MDTQENGSGHTAGIRNAMLQKITKVPMAAENNMNVEVKHRMNNSGCGMTDGRMVKKLVFCAMGGKPGKDGGSG